MNDPGREGTLLDIMHIHGSVFRHEIHINNFELVSEADFIFHTEGSCNKPDEKRTSVAENNVKLTYALFKQFKFHKSPFIIVITNPVEMISQTVLQACPDLSQKIIGTGTFLDTIRLNFYISRELKCDINEVRAWVLGEHGDSMVHVFSKTTVKGKPIFEKTNSKQLEQVTKNTVTAAATIRKTQSGTWYGVAHCAYMIFLNIITNAKGPFPLSIKSNAFYRNLLNLTEDIYISLPAIYNGKGFEPDNIFTLNSMERALLKKSAHILIAQSEKIKHWLNV